MAHLGRARIPVAGLVLSPLLWLAAPAAAAAYPVTFDPPAARPGGTVLVSPNRCGYADPMYDYILFSSKLVEPSPEGIIDLRPDATAHLIPVGGEASEFGIMDSDARFVVPRLPAGDYYVYLSCYDADACCVPIEPTFRVLSIPDTSVAAPRNTAGATVAVLALVFLAATAVFLRRLFPFTRPRRRPASRADRGTGSAEREA